MLINLRSLPLEIYKKIPINIKIYKDEYLLEELPYEIQNLLKDVILKKDLNYDKNKKIYDFKPVISEYGDFSIIDNLRTLILEYINSYFYTTTGEYPFNGDIGSNIKRNLQKKDTTIQKLYLSEELNKIIQNVSRNIDQKISLKNFNVIRKDLGTYTEYYFNVNLNINDQPVNINNSFIL